MEQEMTINLTFTVMFLVWNSIFHNLPPEAIWLMLFVDLVLLSKWKKFR